MSRAFVKENDLEHAGIDIPDKVRLVDEGDKPFLIFAWSPDSSCRRA